MERSVSQLLSSATISNSLLNRSNEAFSTHSTTFPLLSLPTPKRTEHVSHLIMLT